MGLPTRLPEYVLLLVIFRLLSLGAVLVCKLVFGYSKLGTWPEVLLLCVSSTGVLERGGQVVQSSWILHLRVGPPDCSHVDVQLRNCLSVYICLLHVL